MIVVLSMHHGGGADACRMLAALGCGSGPARPPRFEHPSVTEINEEILARFGASWKYTDPHLLSTERARPVEAHLGHRMRQIAEGFDANTIVHDPRLCLTLPWWEEPFRNAIYVIVHRHPFDVARLLRIEHGMPISAGLSLWQLYMLSAIQYSSASPRTFVRHGDLVRDPEIVANILARFLDRRGIHTRANPSPLIGFSGEDDDVFAPRDCTTPLTQAQLVLWRELDAGRVPEIDPEDPYWELAGDPLSLWSELERANARAFSINPELAAELGRERARAWHLELRHHSACERVDMLERELVQARAGIVSLRAEMDALRKSVPSQSLALPAIDYSVQPSAQALAREETAKAIVRRFRQKLSAEWNSTTSGPRKPPGSKRPWVMVGTLSSGENELDRCIESVRRQTYRNTKHEIFTGLSKQESIATLMKAFQASDCDLLVKIDADMVLESTEFVERVVRIFETNREIDLVQVAMWDFFSDRPIQGINTFRRSAEWSARHQDSLFTDRAQIPHHKRMIIWPTFVKDAVHSPDPAPFQAFHFGVHRGVKVLQPERRHDTERAREQLAYLERTWTHFLQTRDRRLALACLGFELALTGRYSLAHLDYTNPHLRSTFSEYEDLDVDQIENAVLQLRARPVASDSVEALRVRRSEILAAVEQPIRTILALLPHTRVYGGVNRFFELARALAPLGVRLVIAQLESDSAGPSRQSTYPDVPVRSYAEVLDQEWDVVLSGDAIGGAMLTMPLVRAKLAAVLLINGWGWRGVNLEIISLVNPDVVLANSSYCAAQFPELAPTVVPGGVDLELFRPRDAPQRRCSRLRIAAYPGRRARSKRFDDTIESCTLLHKRGLPIELHAFDQDTLWLDVPFRFKFHGALDKHAVRDLLWDMDVMVCAEEDGGWSNPAAEAMACGLPLVCTEAGTVDFAVNEDTALVVPTRTPTAIAAAVERLHRDPELAERLRTNGLERIRGFGWTDVARRLVAALATARLDAEARALDNARALERLGNLGALRRR